MWRGILEEDANRQTKTCPKLYELYLKVERIALCKS